MDHLRQLTREMNREMKGGVPHFAEIQTTRPLPMPVLEEAMIRMGLGMAVLDNAERSFDAATPDAPKVVRFITVPEQTLVLRDVGALSWQRCHAVAVPLNGPRPERVEMRPVVRGVLYDLRFLCRTKTAPKAADVRVSILERCGFEVDALCLLKGGIRIQGHPNADVSQWYARARWVKGDSVLTDHDPIIVEEIVRLSGVNEVNPIKDPAHTAGEPGSPESHLNAESGESIHPRDSPTEST